MKIRAMIVFGSLTALFLLFVSGAYGNEFKRTEMQVSGMHCGSCLRVIDSELRKKPGVVGMAASFSEQKVVVDHENAVTSEEIGELITSLGYPTSVVGSDDLPPSELRRFKRAGFGSGSGCCNPGGTNPVAESWRELRRRFLNGRGQGRGPGRGEFRQVPKGSE